jgi:hypothetical protein
MNIVLGIILVLAFVILATIKVVMNIFLAIILVLVFVILATIIKNR